jgi:hypothetical protein
MHVSGRVAAARSDVEIAHHLVDSENALNAAALAPLGQKLLAVSLASTLLDVFANAECPLLVCVCLAHFVAGATAACFDRIWWRVRSIALTTVVWGQMCGGIGWGVPEHQ